MRDGRFPTCKAQAIIFLSSIEETRHLTMCDSPASNSNSFQAQRSEISSRIATDLLICPSRELRLWTHVRNRPSMILKNSTFALKDGSKRDLKTRPWARVDGSVMFFDYFWNPICCRSILGSICRRQSIRMG